MGTFLLLVKKLAVIDHLANRRFCVWGNLNEINAAIAGHVDCIACIHYAQCLTFLGHHPDRRNPNAFVRAVKRLAKTRPVSVSTKSSCDKDLLIFNDDLRDYATPFVSQ